MPVVSACALVPLNVIVPEAGVNVPPAESQLPLRAIVSVPVAVHVPRILMLPVPTVALPLGVNLLPE